MSGSNLGACISEHKASRRQIIVYVLLALFFMGAAAYFPLAAPRFSLPLLVIAGLCTLAAIGFIGWGLSALGKKVCLYEHGLAYIDQKGEHTWRWQEIDALVAKVQSVHGHYGGVSSGTFMTYHYELYTGGKKVLSLDTRYADVKELGDVLTQKTAEVLLPRSIQDLRQGTPVTFGKITVSRQGISQGKKVIPWNTIRKVDVQSGDLILSQDGKKKALFRIYGLPNAHVLVELVQIGLRSRSS